MRYVIERTPDTTLITDGAVISYHARCLDGRRTTINGQGQIISTDWFKWVKIRRRGSGDQILQANRPSGDEYFNVTWDEENGDYAVACGVILNASNSSNRTVNQWVTAAQVIDTERVILQTGRQMRRLDIADPSSAVPRTEMMLSVVERLASRTPPSGAKLTQHNNEVSEMRRYKSALADQLRPTDGKTRYGVRALYFATETQEARPLNVFVCRTNSGSGQQDWTLCDYTSPHTRLHSTHEVSASNPVAAMRDLVEDWRSGFVSGNKYPPGRIQVEIPGEAIGSGPYAERLATTGGTGLDALIRWLTYISSGALGVALLLLPVPGTTAAAVALGTAMFSSTAAGALSIAERRHRGLEWSLVDTVDLLGLASDLLTLGRASQFRRGAAVEFLRPGRRVVERYVFWGHVSVDVANAGATGYLIATEAYEELDRLANNPNLTGAERMHRMQQAIRRMGLQPVAVGLTLRSPGGGPPQGAAPSHLPNDGLHQSISDKLTALGDEASPPIRVGEGVPLEGTTQRPAGGRATVVGRPEPTAARPLMATWDIHQVPAQERGGLHHGTHDTNLPDTLDGQTAAARQMLQAGLPAGSNDRDLWRAVNTSLGENSGFRGATEFRGNSPLWATRNESFECGIVIQLERRPAWDVRSINSGASRLGSPTFAGAIEMEWAILRRIEPGDIVNIWVVVRGRNGHYRWHPISIGDGP